MKTFLALSLMLVMALPSWAATTWPASTNANQTFFGANTFAQPITAQTLTASTVVQGNGSKELSSIPNGTGALTNNGTGTFGWFPDFASFLDLTNLVLSLGTNAFYTNLNAVNINVTNVYASNIFVINLYSLTNLFDYVTVTNGLTNLSLTPNTVLKSDANKRITSIANASGVLTNDGAGAFGWVDPIEIQFTGAGVSVTQTGSVVTAYIPGATNDFTTIFVDTGWITNLYSTSAWISNLYVANGWITNLYSSQADLTNILTQQIDYYTNLCTMAPNFAKGYCAITTNAAFTFLDPIGLDATKTKVQTTVMRVDNSTGPTPIAVTLPANVHAVPGSVFWITNSTWFTWCYYAPDQTNCYAVPIH